ncbi:MAG TPA: hypothetical protein VEP30_08475 [Chthoniobacterales bacterium]|nr:hypothetical protein [Chthoniobacterales bacterium]
MNTQELDIIASFVGLICLWWFWYYCWKPYALARFRQDLFDLRDQLFDSVVEKRYPFTFNSKIYCRTREDLNKMIRFAHEAKPLNVLVALLLDNQSIHAAVKRSQETREQLTNEELELLKFVDIRQKRSLQRYLLTSSFLLWVVIVLMLIPAISEAIFMVYLRKPVLALRAILEKRAISQFLDGVEHQAGQEYLLGAIELQPSCKLAVAR